LVFFTFFEKIQIFISPEKYYDSLYSLLSIPLII
jgi:hypothetical protein